MSLNRKIKETPNLLEITYRWYEPFHKAGCIFFVVWNMLAITLFHQEIYALISGQMTFPKNIFAALTIVMLTGVPTYWFMVLLLNKTVVRFTPQEMSVCHGPLPWRHPNMIYGLQDIQYICVEEICDIDEDIERREVVAMLKNGSQCKLLPNIQTSEESELIRCKANTWLRQRYQTRLPHVDKSAPGAGGLAA
ncbi:hypothetical protein DENIS_0406 [Desulfonema ishimotonii]|uniref:DUF304 domain-containing protein n=1 Tax=Desulfonema ishimotonii TaxID=45657 RepID=A0A401FR77_9BACT|nr:hypothetical protein [Desulfonema ishimotonii]GBC59467.1 hypothetical protein DENIS_0406 [Desulfonema ishimotonii]